jgi:hypothetical protein
MVAFGVLTRSIQEKLDGLPNVVPVLGYYETAGDLCIVMPRFVGSVSDALRKAGGPLDEPTALRIAVDMFIGLCSLHNQGILHRVCRSTLCGLEIGLRTFFLIFFCRTSSLQTSC